MVNQAFRIKIAYRSEKKKKKENTRDRSVPGGSDKHRAQISPEAERCRSAGATVELGTELLFPTLVDGMRVETHFPVRPSISVEV